MAKKTIKKLVYSTTPALSAQEPPEETIKKIGHKLVYMLCVGYKDLTGDSRGTVKIKQPPQLDVEETLKQINFNDDWVEIL